MIDFPKNSSHSAVNFQPFWEENQRKFPLIISKFRTWSDYTSRCCAVFVEPRKMPFYMFLAFRKCKTEKEKQPHSNKVTEWHNYAHFRPMLLVQGDFTCNGLHPPIKRGHISEKCRAVYVYYTCTKSTFNWPLPVWRAEGIKTPARELQLRRSRKQNKKSN